MKTYQQLIEACLESVKEVFPWDLEEQFQSGNKPIILDIREPEEFDEMWIEGSVNIPRGILEQSCEWDFEETVPVIVKARDKEILLVCQSGNRSVLAAYTLWQMGCQDVKSLKTGLRGWNDYEQPLVDNENNSVDIEDADQYFLSKVKPEQPRPE